MTVLTEPVPTGGPVVGAGSVRTSIHSLLLLASEATLSPLPVQTTLCHDPAGAAHFYSALSELLEIRVGALVDGWR